MPERGFRLLRHTRLFMFVAIGLYWAMDGFTEIIARGGSLSDIMLPIMVLLGFAVVFIGVGISRIKYE